MTTRRFNKIIFPLIAMALLFPWPVAYAYDYNNDVVGQGGVLIEAAEDSAQPSWEAFGGVIGGVTTPGDIFYIDVGDYPADIAVTLYIINTDELIRSYRYLTLKVGIYAQNDLGEWQTASGTEGGMLPDSYITLRNGQVSFVLPGHGNYKVTIDSGSFNCISANAANGSTSPRFYLTAG